MKLTEIHIRTTLFALAVLAVLWGFHAMILEHAPVAFQVPVEDMSYGWYVPLFSLYVLWSERRELVASASDPSWKGVLFVIPFLLLGFLGARGLQLRFEIIGFSGVMLALAWSFFGIGTMRRMLFPMLFLLFCMPMYTYLDMVMIHLRLLAVAVASGTLQGCGIEVIRQGTMLASPTGSFAIDVAAPCSGMRSLFALMALTVGYAYFTQPNWIRRGILSVLSIPIAIFGNVMRILSIAFISATCSPEFATGFYHDYSGYVVFFCAILLMVAAGGAITKGAERCASF